MFMSPMQVASSLRDLQQRISALESFVGVPVPSSAPKGVDAEPEEPPTKNVIETNGGEEAEAIRRAVESGTPE